MPNLIRVTIDVLSNTTNPLIGLSREFWYLRAVDELHMLAERAKPAYVTELRNQLDAAYA